MAAGTPLNRLALAAGSVADDLGYAALNDLAGALGDMAADYRVIGGHMVTMLAARWQLGAGLYRETGDVDLGIPPIVARDKGVVSRLKGISYLQVAGNRFARALSDIPVGMTDERDSRNPEALIDVLVPTYTSRTRENVRVGEDLFDLSPVARTPSVWGQAAGPGGRWRLSNVTGLCIPMLEWRL
jgi:hypothetical protein